MGLFNKKPAHICETSYDDVVSYLRDLEQADYSKILKVVSTYREADKKVKKILNIKDEPVAAEFEPLLEDDWTDNLLEDDQDTKASKNQRLAAEKAKKGKK